MISIAIVGAGFMGNTHAACYHNLFNAKLVAIVDTDMKKAIELGERYGATAFASLEDMIKNQEVDAVDICLPTFLHREYVIKAAKAGKHILCEKPIALNLIDAEDMIRAAEKAEVKFMVAQVIRFWPEYIKLKEIYDTGRLGKMRSIALTRLSSLPVWSCKNWLLDGKKSGSALMDLHIHDTDYLLYILGKPSFLFSRASISSIGYGHIFTTFSFPGGVTALVEGGWDIYNDAFPFTMTFRAVFDRGVVEFNNRQEKTLSIYQSGKKVKYLSTAQPSPASQGTNGNITELGGYFSELKYFIDCIENHQPPLLADATSARDSLGVVLLEKQSIESKEIVVL